MYRIKWVGQFNTVHYVKPIVGQKWEEKYGKYNRLHIDPAHYWTCKNLNTAKKMLEKILEHIEDKIKWDKLEQKDISYWEEKFIIEKFQKGNL